MFSVVTRGMSLRCLTTSYEMSYVFFLKCVGSNGSVCGQLHGRMAGRVSQTVGRMSGGWTNVTATGDLGDTL